MQYKVRQKTVTQSSSTTNILNSYICVAIGIQGAPGTCFNFGDSNSTFQLGRSGIYEINLENTKATINTLYITDIVSGSVIVDFKYIDSEGGNNQ